MRSSPSCGHSRRAEMREGDANLITAEASANRLLESYGICRPADIRIEDIAWDLGIEIEVDRLPKARGHLVRKCNTGIITISDAISDEGERRFVIAHELGHWQLHRYHSQFFFCDEENLREYRNSGPELEANTFASELLVPTRMVPRAKRVADPSWETIAWLKSEFSVSQTSAAVRYAGLCEHAVLVAFSNGRQVMWWRRNDRKADMLWLESRQQIDEESQLSDIVNNGAVDGELVPVSWHAWFPHLERYDGAELFELSVPVDDNGTMMSLLWAPGL